MSKLAKCSKCDLDAVGCNPIFHEPFCVEHLKVECLPYECDECGTRFNPGEQVYRWNEDVVCGKCLEQVARDEMIENYEWVSDE